MTRLTRLKIRAAMPYITGALVLAFVLAVYGFVGRMEYNTLKIIYGQ